MTKEIYVIYWGRQNHVHMSPLRVDNTIVWFDNPADASHLVSQLNSESQQVFYGEGSTYTRLTNYTDEGGAVGSLDYYPIQYNWKKVRINDSPSQVEEAFETIQNIHYTKWKNIYEQDD